MTCPVPEVKDLEFFAAVCEARAFARAAQALNTSSSNVCTRMRELEEKLGVRLFVRQRYGVELTEKGIALRRHAQVVLAKMKQIPAILEKAKSA